MFGFFKWQKGRQDGGYQKKLILTAMWPLPFDVHLIRYPEGKFIHPHTDPVSNMRHFRLNIILKKSPQGGEFICSKTLFSNTRIHLFRPDEEIHSVTPSIGGPRYVLSIGWVLKGVTP